MKLLKNNLIKKIVISILIVLLCNISLPNVCRAVNTDSSDYIATFYCSLSDAVFYLLQHFFLGEGEVAIECESDEIDDENGIWNYIDMFGIVYNGEFDLPNIRFTPYAIFANKIPILNANFFGDPIVVQKTYYTFKGYVPDRYWCIIIAYY